MRHTIPQSVATLALSGALAGCATVATVEADLSSGAYAYDSIELGAYRAYQATFAETPFAEGAISVIATQGGDLLTYTLVPCRNGAQVCAGSAQGAAGPVEVTPDYTIVRGLYGAEFWLSPGGDGALVRRGETVSLAWE